MSDMRLEEEASRAAKYLHAAALASAIGSGFFFYVTKSDALTIVSVIAAVTSAVASRSWFLPYVTPGLKRLGNHDSLAVFASILILWMFLAAASAWKEGRNDAVSQAGQLNNLRNEVADLRSEINTLRLAQNNLTLRRETEELAGRLQGQEEILISHSRRITELQADLTSLSSDEGGLKSKFNEYATMVRVGLESRPERRELLSRSCEADPALLDAGVAIQHGSDCLLLLSLTALEEGAFLSTRERALSNFYRAREILNDRTIDRDLFELLPPLKIINFVPGVSHFTKKKADPDAIQFVDSLIQATLYQPEHPREGGFRRMPNLYVER